MKVVEYYMVVAHYNKEHNIIEGWLPGRSNTYEEAVKHWEKECRDRNKGDGHDEYWRKVPCMIEHKLEISHVTIQLQ